MKMQFSSECDASLRIRPAILADLDAIVEIHLAAFSPEFTLSKLGRHFLRPYYTLILNFEKGILFVAELDNEVVGFVAGFHSPRFFYQKLKASKWRFLFAILLGILKKPSTIKRVISSLKQIKRNSKTGSIPDESFCRLNSLAVRPTFKNRGIGKALVHKFIQEAEKRSLSVVVLITYTENNDAVNTFYQRLGFHHTDTFYRSHGKPMNEYRFWFNQEEPFSSTKEV
jgi:ribosomal protein S18 acetylase RimI-like enzyme